MSSRGFAAALGFVARDVVPALRDFDERDVPFTPAVEGGGVALATAAVEGAGVALATAAVEGGGVALATAARGGAGVAPLAPAAPAPDIMARRTPRPATS